MNGQAGAGAGVHRIVVERDEDGVSHVQFVCDGGDDARCHHWPDCGCEQWGEQHGNPSKGIPPEPGHENVPQAHCWIEPWFNETTDSPFDFAELYDGREDYEAGDLNEWLIAGRVETFFQGDYMTWEYAS